uniref:Wall-associated receptor kinase C-terminal domain-containing protein n=1 Tax=Chenopodium quinoa TaxID=63459 RepID=A0A803KU61_CHEQI
MFTCNTSSTSLFFVTPNGNYKVESVDYKSQTLTVYDPDMSTCTVLQPHHDVRLTDIQYAIIPPSPDTVFALLNCSIDSPILHRFSSLCFEFAGHKCQELYSSCNSFRIFTTAGLVNPGASNNTGPAGVPDMGCERCTKSGGNCGFDVETEALLCLCPDSNNSTRQCVWITRWDSDWVELGSSCARAKQILDRVTFGQG